MKYSRKSKLRHQVGTAAVKLPFLQMLLWLHPSVSMSADTRLAQLSCVSVFISPLFMKDICLRR